MSIPGIPGVFSDTLVFYCSSFLCLGTFSSPNPQTWKLLKISNCLVCNMDAFQPLLCLSVRWRVELWLELWTINMRCWLGRKWCINSKYFFCHLLDQNYLIFSISSLKNAKFVASNALISNNSKGSFFSWPGWLECRQRKQERKKLDKRKKAPNPPATDLRGRKPIAPLRMSKPLLLPST